jgi:hypothetical protein
MQIKDVPVGSRVRVNIYRSYFDEISKNFDPSKPYIDGVRAERDSGHGLAFIAWRQGEETTNPFCGHTKDGFVSGAFISENTACVVAP